MKVKVYIMHSDKIDYKEEIYRPLLRENLMEDFFLILPLSNRYSENYVKELIKESDLIICDLTKSNIFLNLEMKWANKENKEIYYFIKKDDKQMKKFDRLKPNIYNDKEEFASLVKTLLNSLDKKKILLKRDNIYCLGYLNK